MAQINASIFKEHYVTKISSTLNSLIADEPKANGGKESGFSPSELLASSLGACTCITLRMYADRKMWPLESVETIVSFERDATQNVSNITRRITLTGNLDEEQRTRLLQIADQCPIHKTLSNPINIHTELL